MSSTKRTSAPRAEPGSGRAHSRKGAGRGVDARWLFGGALSSGLTAPEILVVFAWCYLRTLVQMILLRAAPTRWITLQHLLKDAGTRERRSASTQVPFSSCVP